MYMTTLAIFSIVKVLSNPRFETELTAFDCCDLKLGPRLSSTRYWSFQFDCIRPATFVPTNLASTASLAADLPTDTDSVRIPSPGVIDVQANDL